MELKESKKEELVDIASKLFYHQGFQATGIKQIIEEAGIAKGTFYSHFKSKEELGLAWLRKRHTVWTKWREDFLAKGSSNPKSQILNLFAFLRDFMQDCDYRGCAFINTMAETPDYSCAMRREVKSHKQSLLDFIQNLVNQIFPDRSKARNKQTASAIFLLFEASMLETQNFADTWPVDVATKQVKELLAK